MDAAPFRKHVNGMPNMGQGRGWTVTQWKKAPIRRVRIADLIATNLDGYLDERRVARYAQSARHDEPCVVEHRGHLYVADGHHRAAAAHQRGETYIRARVMRINRKI